MTAVHDFDAVFGHGRGAQHPYPYFATAEEEVVAMTLAAADEISACHDIVTTKLSGLKASDPRKVLDTAVSFYRALKALDKKLTAVRGEGICERDVVLASFDNPNTSMQRLLVKLYSIDIGVFYMTAKSMKWETLSSDWLKYSDNPFIEPNRGHASFFITSEQSYTAYKHHAHLAAKAHYVQRLQTVLRVGPHTYLTGEQRQALGLYKQSFARR